MNGLLVRMVALAAALCAIPGAANAQIRDVDPDARWQQPATPAPNRQVDPSTGPDLDPPLPEDGTMPTDSPPPPSGDAWTPIGNGPDATEPGIPSTTVTGARYQGSTVPREDVFSAAEGVFGRGAAGLGGILEDILRDQGEPVAYITGQEAAGAFILGVRYGSGIMHHRTLGDHNVYWRGPSVGFDFGADASKVFVLVYNLNSAQDIYRRYIGGEGRAYFVGGFTATYLRRGDVVLIPVRLGVGLRLGVNAGYMRFSERNRWLPF